MRFTHRYGLQRPVRVVRLVNKLDDPYGSYDSWVTWTTRTGRTDGQLTFTSRYEPWYWICVERHGMRRRWHLPPPPPRWRQYSSLLSFIVYKEKNIPTSQLYSSLKLSQRFTALTEILTHDFNKWIPVRPVALRAFVVSSGALGGFGGQNWLFVKREPKQSYVYKKYLLSTVAWNMILDVFSWSCICKYNSRVVWLSVNSISNQPFVKDFLIFLFHNDARPGLPKTANIWNK